MLTYLAIRNLALIDSLELELEPGLTVITGETGAGKSMLLAGLSLLLGERSRKEQVRGGEGRITVEGIWRRGAWQAVAPELLDDENESDEVAVSRIVTVSGDNKRDRMRLDDRVTGLRAVNQVAPDLVSLASQHEYVHLLKRAKHIHLLDAFGQLDDSRAAVAARYEAWAELARRVTDIETQTEQRARRIGELHALVNELSEAEIGEGEEEELLETIARLSHAVEISQALQQGIETLYEGDGDLLSELGHVSGTLAAIARYEPGVESLVERLDGLGAELEDVVDQLRRLEGRLEVEPNLLDHLQERLALLQKLKRRHRLEDADQLLGLLAEATAELETLESEDHSLDDLRQARDEARDALVAAARALHDERLATGEKLGTALQEVLAELAMAQATFTAEIEFDDTRIGPLGGDRVEFLLSANPGQPPMPLQKIASGGELSRVLLAFKVVLADAYPVPTYVFDEIDAGIGGATALAVGRLLARMARGQQVLCITHTPQLAAYADHHLVVSKETVNHDTVTRVTPLPDAAAREAEVARMLSGMTDSTTARKHARELLAKARSER